MRLLCGSSLSKEFVVVLYLTALMREFENNIFTNGYKSIREGSDGDYIDQCIDIIDQAVVQQVTMGIDEWHSLEHLMGWAQSIVSPIRALSTGTVF